MWFQTRRFVHAFPIYICLRKTCDRVVTPAQQEAKWPNCRSSDPIQQNLRGTQRQLSRVCLAGGVVTPTEHLTRGQSYGCVPAAVGVATRPAGTQELTALSRLERGQQRRCKLPMMSRPMLLRAAAKLERGQLQQRRPKLLTLLPRPKLTLLPPKGPGEPL